ncbi:MAG: GcrA family cell cycle regulator [Alphaproteobacteria bacterium]
MSWTPERIGNLESLWAEGHSTAEIGRRLGVSKNAVVGKAHRLGLPGRQSPIDAKRRQAKKDAAPAATARTTTPRTKAAPQAAPAAAPTAAAAKPRAAAAAPAPAAATARAKPSKPHTGPSCQWPFGDPRLPGFHFCGAASVSGKPYCDEHCAAAYNRVSSSGGNRTSAQAA